VAEAAKLIGTTSSFDYTNSSSVTAGPFQVQTYVLNDRIVFPPMKDWHGPGGP
jgi:hypothetical protein